MPGAAALCGTVFRPMVKKAAGRGVASGRYNATPSAPGTSSCLFALAQQVRHQQPAGATALPYSAFVTKLSASSRASSAAVRRPGVQAAFEVRAQVSAR